MAIFLIAAAIAAAPALPAPVSASAASSYAGAAAASAAGHADADPAIWVVNDADTVIYLFGTFHALDGRSAWFNDEVKTAFARSDELVLETIVPETPRIPSRQRARNLAATAPASFLASTRMAIAAGRARGMTADYGADMVLRRAAQASGKPIGGLESFHYQLGMFNRMPEQASHSVAPRQDLSSAGNLAIVMGQMQSAWNRGDCEIFAAMLNQMQANSPQNYNVMFTQRNSNWAAWIARRMDKPGTLFVAIGMGHLAGPDSVQSKLGELGVRSERIN